MCTARSVVGVNGFREKVRTVARAHTEVGLEIMLVSRTDTDKCIMVILHFRSHLIWPVCQK